MPYQDRGIGVSRQIHRLFSCLNAQTYNEVAPKLEYWIERALTQQLTTADKLVEHISELTWTTYCCPTSFARFLKEFRDSPHRSAQARSFVDELSARVLQWFAAASAEVLDMNRYSGTVASGGGYGFIEAASFVGHLVERGLLDHRLVRLHLIKPLTTHYYPRLEMPEETVKSKAVCRLFVVAGSTLVQGLLEPEDVQLCFRILDTQLSRPSGIEGWSAEKLEELRELHAAWLQRNDEEERNNVAEAVEGREGEEEGEVNAEITAEVETPVAFAPQDLPTTISLDIPSPILQATGISSVLHNVEPFPNTFSDDRISAVSSPTSSIFTISDLASTEFDEVTEEGSGERIPTHHETFYLEDGNVEIVCGHTVFRIHSPIVSFSSPNLREILSSSTLLSAPVTEGFPRVTFKDSAEDFAVLLRMIYTPGFPARHKVPEFTTFASLLRMATKYGFSDIREGLIEDLKVAYPTKWEDFETAKVLGEDVFGSPKPHPNAVLNLLLEQRVKFALPFAAYRAAIDGFSSLISNEPGTVLPRLTLASTIYGIERIRRVMTYTAQTIIHNRNLGACAERTCALNVGINPAERRAEALKKISDTILQKSEGDMLSPLSLGNPFCVGCGRRLENIYRDYQKQLVWTRLPSLLGWESWEGIS